MKIKHKDLQNIYKTYLLEKTPSSRKNCPSPEDILDFLRKKLSKNKTTKLLNHITNCYYCAQELEYAKNILKYESKLNEEISQMIQSFQKKEGTLQEIHHWKFRIKNWLRLFAMPKRLKYAMIFAGATVLLFIITAFLLKSSRTTDYRSTGTSQIQLSKPIYNTVQSLLTFRWSSIHESDYYILELFDETLYPVWKSEGLSENQLTLPRDISQKLQKNKPYFWMVTAFLPNGQKIESSLKEFFIKQ